MGGHVIAETWVLIHKNPQLLACQHVFRHRVAPVKHDLARPLLALLHPWPALIGPIAKGRGRLACFSGIGRWGTSQEDVEIFAK